MTTTKTTVSTSIINRILDNNIDCEEYGIIIPPEFICPITHEIMKQPIATRYGQTYERNAIVEWILQHDTCPFTRQPLHISDLVTNHFLSRKIEMWVYVIALELPDSIKCSSSTSLVTTQQQQDYDSSNINDGEYHDMYKEAAANGGRGPMLILNIPQNRRRKKRNRRHRRIRWLGHVTASTVSS